MLYLEGAPVTVTYYKTSHAPIDIRTGPSDISQLGHSVHKDFTKIHDLEMRLQGDLAGNFQDEDNSFEVTGEAVLYPGFEPNVGDIFFLSLGNGKIGEFKVDNKTPMTYRQGKCYKISFNLLRYVTAQSAAKLEEGVRETLYFDKKMYAGEGAWTLLTHESFITYKSLESLRKELIQHYMNKFFATDSGSFLRPDGIYDPYVVSFWRKKLSWSDINRKIDQLTHRVRDYHKCIWYMFTDRVNTYQLEGITATHSFDFMTADALATDHNALLNRHYLVLEDNGGERQSYVFSSNFYSEYIDQMNDVERMVYVYLKERKIDPSVVVNLCEQYPLMSDMDQFYLIPVCIELIDTAIYSLKG